MSAKSAMLNVMTAAALKAGRAVLRDFGELDKLQVSRKSVANFATNSDKRSEKILHDELAKARPAFGFIMEESGEIEGRDKTQRFVIDPIDGTHNFIHAVPYFCIAIAYEKQLNNGKFETQAGVIYDPIHNELFCAEMYQGVTMNDQRVSVSKRREIDTCMIASYVPHGSDGTDNYGVKVYNSISSNPLSLRATGSTALDLAYVAAGRYDGGCWVSYRHWDIAAGRLMVREAGGKITERDDEGKKLLFVSNPDIHARIADPLLKL